MRGFVSILAAALFSSFLMSVSFAADGKVQFMDISDKNANFVELAPGVASKNERLSLIVHTNDKGILRVVYTTLQEVEATIGKDVVMLQAAPIENQDGLIKIGYYYDGLPTGTSHVSVNTADTPLRERIVKAIEEGISTTEEIQ